MTLVQSSARWPIDCSPALPTWNLYRVVESVARLPDGIALCGTKKRWRKLGLDASGKLRITTPASVQVPAPQTFSGQPRKTKHGCTLQVAQFPDGSKVFLDSRGLLHLKSGDPNLPEVSLVLADGEVAGWTSDGFVCGHPFFFDGPRVSEPERIFEQMLKFLARL